MATVFEKLAKDLYVTPYREIAKKFNFIFQRLKDSQGLEDDGFVESVGQVKEINANQFQFQATVHRDLEAESNGKKFHGFNQLVKHLSIYLGRPKEFESNSAAWEIIEKDKEPIRIHIVAYDAGHAATHSVKVTIGPLRASYL